MKKIFALLVCLALMTGCAAGVTEAAEKQSLGTVRMEDAFELRCALPEGYRLTVLEGGGDSARLVALIDSPDGTKPVMYLSMAYNDLASEVERLNDLDEAALEKIADTFRAEDEVEITYPETAYGTRLLMAKEVRETVDFVDFYTMYKGYEIEFVLTRGPEASAEAGITDAQIQMAIDFLSELDFVEIGA